MGEDNAGGADRREGLAVLDDAGADRSRRVVAGAADDDGAFLQAGQGGRLGGHGAGHFGRFIDLAQQVFVDVQLFQHLVRPAAVRDVQQLHPGGVGDLGCELAGQFIPDIVLRQQDFRAFGVIFRLVVADPEDFGGGKAGEGGVGGDLDQPFGADLLCNLLALLRGRTR